LLGSRFGLFSHALRLALGGFGTLGGSISGFLGSLSLQPSGISLQPNWLIDLYHFMNLPTNGGERESDKDNRDPFSKLLSAILALFFFAIGNAFIFYGVNKSREIGG
jgi:hypothetical protein